MLHRPLLDFLPRGTPAALPVGAAAAGGGGVRQHPHQCPPRFSSPTGQAYQLSVPCRSLDTAAAAAALFLLLCALLSPLPGPASSLLLQLQPRDGGKPAATRG